MPYLVFLRPCRRAERFLPIPSNHLVGDTHRWSWTAVVASLATPGANARVHFGMINHTRNQYPSSVHVLLYVDPEVLKASIQAVRSDVGDGHQAC
jgi:hypothetical protein